MPLILASASPRRLDLLRQIGIEPQVEPSEIDEAVPAGADAATAVRELAVAKAEHVAARHAGEAIRVLGADTAVVVDGTPLGKPADAADAARVLRRLSGRAHQVMTGVALVDAASGERVDGVAVTEVRMRPLSDAEIDTYVATGEPLDKAGSYGIQGRAAVFVEGIVGDHSNVVGLPLPLVDELLARLPAHP